MTGTKSSDFFSLLKPGSRSMNFIICFFLAAGIWVLNTLSKNYVSAFDIRYEFPLKSNSDENNIIHATISGRGFDLIRLNNLFDGIHQLNDPKEGKISSKEIIQNILGTKKNSFQLLNVDPEFISLTEMGKVHKRVPVINKIELFFQKQTTLAAPVMIKPDSIDISGSAEEIKSISSIETAPLKLLNVEKSVFRSVELETPSMKNIHFSRNKVWLYVAVEKFTEGSFEIPVLGIFKGKTQVRLIPEKVTVKFRVPVSKYNMVQADQFKAGVYVSSYGGKNKLPVTLIQKPKFTSQVTFSPNEVNYLIFD